MMEGRIERLLPPWFSASSSPRCSAGQGSQDQTTKRETDSDWLLNENEACISGKRSVLIDPLKSTDFSFGFYAALGMPFRLGDTSAGFCAFSQVGKACLRCKLAKISAHTSFSGRIAKIVDWNIFSPIKVFLRD